MRELERVGTASHRIFEVSRDLEQVDVPEEPATLRGYIVREPLSPTKIYC